MSASLERLFKEWQTSTYIREIDRDYHIEMIAEDTRQIKKYHASALHIQAEVAAVNLRAMGELAQGQDQTNAYLGGMAQDISAMACDIERMNAQIDRLNESMDELNATAEETLYAIHDLSRILSEGLDRISQQMMQHQKTLEDIAEVLRRPYETKTLELRREADKWVISGMKNTGRDRDEDWKDAKRLLRTIIENPIGIQDYVAWFQIGWLLWKHEQNIAEAEEAFYRAQRLSAHKRDLYHVKSLRHLAYIHYLQGKYEEAYQTIQKALSVNQDHDTMYDAARYAAKTGRTQESLDLLDRCIDLQPTTIITMFSEVDFQ